jgi:AcrR family transcriptional regulator
VTEALLCDAALRLLDRDGVLAGISLQDVADEAGLSRGLINHYFGSRRALLRSALESRRLASVEGFEQQRHASPEDRFVWFWKGIVRDPHWAEMMALLAIDRDEDFAPIHMLDDVVQADIDAGVYGPEFDAVASHLVALALACGWSLLRESFARQLDVPVKQLDQRSLAFIDRMGTAIRTDAPPAESEA